MGTTTIHSTAYQLIVDASKFHGPMIATRKETRAADRALRNIQSPLQRYEDKSRDIANLAKKGLLTRQQALRALELERGKLDQASGAAKRRADAEKEIQRSKQRGLTITNSVLTAEERFIRDQREINQLLQRGHISLDVRNRKLGQLRENYEKASGPKGIGKFTKMLKAGRGALVGATIPVALIARETQKSFERIDATAKLADRLGVSYEFLKRQQFAVGRASGLTSDQFSKGMEKMTRRVSEAAQGIGEARGAIDELGLDAKRLAAIGPEKAYFEIADAMKNVTAEHDRLRLATKLFDDEQAAIHAALRNGSKLLRDQGKEVDRLGVSLNRIEAKNIEKVNDLLSELANTFKGIFDQLSNNISPAILDLARNAPVPSKNGLRRATDLSHLFDMPNAAIQSIQNGNPLGVVAKFFEIRDQREVKLQLQRETAEAVKRQREKKAERELATAEKARKAQQKENSKQLFKNAREALTGLGPRFEAAVGRPLRFKIRQLPGIDAGKALKGLGLARDRTTEKVERTVTNDLTNSVASGSSEAFRLLNQTQATAVQKQQMTAQRQLSELGQQTKLLDQLADFFMTKQDKRQNDAFGKG